MPDRAGCLSFLAMIVVCLAFWSVLLWAYVIGSR